MNKYGNIQPVFFLTALMLLLALLIINVTVDSIEERNCKELCANKNAMAYGYLPSALTTPTPKWEFFENLGSLCSCYYRDRVNSFRHGEV